MQILKPLTMRQKEVLDFINSYFSDNGFTPSLKEIAQFLKTENLSTAQYFVEELKKKNYINKSANKSRGISPVSFFQTVPLLGFIAAGEPIEPLENSEPIAVPEYVELKKGNSYYALRVKGDSMIDMGILDGDTVLIKHQLDAEDGDVVVGVTEDGATLKILRKRNGQIYLEPRNSLYSPIYPQQLDVRGILVGVLRTN